MENIANYFEQAQLSMAAYALDLQRGAFGSQNSEYVASLKAAGMSQEQAEVFADTYSVVDQFTDPISGFSGTIFDKNGTKFIAIRGTEGFTFAGAQDWLTNVEGVSEEGIAIAQSLAMFNWLQRLTGNAGNSVVQYIFDPITRSLITTSGIASGLLAGQSSISVTGHSLGGHLAMILSRLAPDLVSAAYTFNAPGFDTLIRRSLFALGSEGFFNLLINAPIGPITGAIGTAWDSNIMTHLDVEGDVVHTIGTTPGTQTIFFTESTNQGVYDAHLKEAITDSLAVINLFSSLDQNISLGIASEILEASSNQADASLEAVVSALGILLDPSFTENPLSDINVSIGDRDRLYTNIYAIQNNLSQITGYENFTITSLKNSVATELKLKAEGDPLVLPDPADAIAYRYALVNLNPFVITGELSIYDQHNPNHELDLYDPMTGMGDLTEHDLEDRAAFLQVFIAAAGQDESSVDVVIDETYHESTFTDLSELNPPLVISNDPSFFFTEKQYIFGSDVSDGRIDGDSHADHIYGGGGIESIYGYQGNDYIEGNGDDDVLVGGADPDELVGGKGNDILYNGNDDQSDDHARDLLDGGDDYDTYYVGLGDRIRDRDGSGEIHINGQLINIGSIVPVSAGMDVFTNQDPVDPTYFQLQPDNSLRIMGRYVEIVDFTNGDFGITLDANAPPPTLTLINGTGSDDLDASGTAVTGSLADEELHGLGGNDDVFGLGGNYVLFGEDGDDRLIGEEGHDVLSGGAGSDILFSKAGKDLLQGDAGDDLLVAGADDDFLEGGLGNDGLFGGGGTDTLFGGDGNDVLWGDGLVSVPDRNWDITVTYPDAHNVNVAVDGIIIDPDPASDAADLLNGGAGNDVLFGGGGDDQLNGEDDNDFLIGGDGSDRLEGGAGDDNLFGDDTIDGGAGNDTIDGGSGNDQLSGGAGVDRIQVSRPDPIVILLVPMRKVIHTKRVG